MNSSTDWFAKLSKLRVDRASGQAAPHKPLLLLALISRLDEGEQLPEVMTLSPELAYRFLILGSVVAHRQSQKLDIRLPFQHLQTDGVWHVFDRTGQPSQAFRHVAAVRINADFAAFIANDLNRATRS